MTQGASGKYVPCCRVLGEWCGCSLAAEEQELDRQYLVPRVLTRDSRSVFKLGLSRGFLSLRCPKGVNYEFIWIPYALNRSP